VPEWAWEFDSPLSHHETRNSAHICDPAATAVGRYDSRWIAKTS
jgi:hypothetical protein